MVNKPDRRAGAAVPRQKGTVMIDLKKARWDLSPEEKYAVKWLVENGFEGELARQYVSKTMFTARKDGVETTFELPQGVQGVNVKAYMEFFRKEFAMLQAYEAQKGEAHE